MAIPTHLTEADYEKLFPDMIDEFPTVINEQHYIDAWLLNSAFNSLLSIEEYILNWQANIEAPLGDDIIGIEGQLLIDIPPARYPAYKQALAWDSNLLAENIAQGETIFGVTGSLIAGGGGIAISLPALDIQPFVFITPPALSMDSAIPAISLPTIVVV